jgi:hypothetical protein
MSSSLAEENQLTVYISSFISLNSVISYHEKAKQLVQPTRLPELPTFHLATTISSPVIRHVTLWVFLVYQRLLSLLINVRLCRCSLSFDFPFFVFITIMAYNRLHDDDKGDKGHDKPERPQT